MDERMTHYFAAISEGHTRRSATREAFIRTYRITTIGGEFMSRERVIAAVGAELHRHGVARPRRVARRFVDDHEWMRFRAGETAGSVARAVADACVGEWGSAWVKPD
jgi:hypothetical protein